MTDVTTTPADFLKQGDLLPVASVAEQLTGKRPSRPTIWRWMRKGVSGGIKLKAVPIYGTWHTTEAAFRHFLDRRAEAMLAQADETPEADDDTLRAAGLL